MQQLVVKNSLSKFSDEVNSLLMEGWRVVPGTLHAASYDTAPRRETPEWAVLPDGRTPNSVFMCVVENEEAR